MKKSYKVFDTVKQLYWNGGHGTNFLTATGDSWGSLTRVRYDVERFIKNHQDKNVTEHAYENWDIIEFELQAKEIDRLKCKNLIANTILRNKLKAEHWKLPLFYDEMVKRKCIDKIEFAIILSEGRHSYANILEARAQLRLIGVKTRSFRENRGIFGMLDRDQAMKARLCLSFSKMVDVGEIRRNLEKENQKSG